jgi:DHA1 family tetracycline resistance protein-like MFS transporter
VWFTAPLTKRFGAYALAQAGIILVAIGLAAVPPSSSIPWLLLALGIFGVGSAILNPTFSNLVAGLSGADERGAALGAYQSAASFGRVLGPFLASGVATVSNLSWPFVVGAVVAVAGVPLIVRARGVAGRVGRG